MRPSGKAWTAIGAGVLAYDILCPQGETLSEGMDGALERPFGRYLAIGAVAITGAHLLNALPERLDPLHQVLKVIQGRL